MIARALLTGILVAILGTTLVLIAMIAYSWATYGADATAEALEYAIRAFAEQATTTLMGATR